MERPSHIAFGKHSSWSGRASFFAMAIGLQLAGFWLFTHGLATQVQSIFHTLDFVAVHDNDRPALPPPPEPPMQLAVTPNVPLPEFSTAQPENDNSITAVTAQPPSNDTPVKEAAGANRAPVGILSTHTVPPYPPVARRLGEEGKVTLRLSVSAEGRVTRAEIVTSSGRDELDQSAQQWIVAHWIYKPALGNGVAVAGQVMAIVTFSLSNPR